MRYNAGYGLLVLKMVRNGGRNDSSAVESNLLTCKTGQWTLKAIVTLTEDLWC